MSDKKNEPIFQSIFGQDWPSLPIVFHKHYANRPFTNDLVLVKGKMNITMSFLARLLSPLFRITGALVPYTGNNIPTEVYFRSEVNSNVFCFDRAFHFPEKSTYHFRSRLYPLDNGEVIELMPIGLGWRPNYLYDENKIKLKHRGYVINLFGKYIPLPLEILLGKGYAEEWPLSDNDFAMCMTIDHPILGQIFSYSGEFTIMEMNLDR